MYTGLQIVARGVIFSRGEPFDPKEPVTDSHSIRGSLIPLTPGHISPSLQTSVNGYLTAVITTVYSYTANLFRWRLIESSNGSRVPTITQSQALDISEL